MVPGQSLESFPMLEQCPVEPREISRQLWAVLGSLVAGDAGKDGTFKSATRHNGLEAWRQIALPIHEDRALILQELLPAITNPKPASDINRYEEAIHD